MEGKQWWEQPDWILLGDGSRYEFLCWMLPWEVKVSELPEHPVMIRAGRSFRLEQREGTVCLTVSSLPPRTLLFLPPQQDAYPKNPEPGGARCAVFEEHPFKKESTLALCDALAGQNAAFQAVFMDLPRRYAATDLDQPGQALAEAQKDCAERGTPYQTVRGGADILSVLCWRQPLADHWLRDMDQRLNELRERIEDLVFDYEYLLGNWEEENGLLSAQALERLCSWDTVRHSSQETLWGCFAERGLQRLFPQRMACGLFPVVELYQSCIQECRLGFLPLEKDGELLWAEMKKAAEDTFRQAARAGNRPFPFDEKAYRELVARPASPCFGLDAAFEQVFSDFVRKRPLESCKKLLERRYGQLKQKL